MEENDVFVINCMESFEKKFKIKIQTDLGRNGK